MSSTIEATFVSFLQAVPAVVAALPGGIYSAAALGEPGLVNGNPLAASAFTTTNGLPILRPSLVVRIRLDTPTYTRYDTNTHETSTDGTAGVWFYAHSSAALVDAAAEAVWRALQGRVVPGVGLVRSINRQPGLFAPEFNLVALRVDDYLYKRIQRSP